MQLDMFGGKTKSKDWDWSFKDYPEKNGLKVFSTFACGGGSTMGYKLAGCDVLGCVEIDSKMNSLYVKNHNPKHNYLMDIRKFNEIPNEELPKELFNIDILDASPPCTTFSTAGQREDSWGVKKKFREGQAEQTLDDLSFVFIDTVNKLKPKVVVMENVEGLIMGSAWKYVQEIYKKFKEIGYSVKYWLLKGVTMGVPQTRNRVFFVAVPVDKEHYLEKMDMYFNYEPVTYGDIKTGSTRKIGKQTETYRLLQLYNGKDKSIGDINLRETGKVSAFQTYLINEEDVVPTIRSSPDIIDVKELGYISAETMVRSQTFPKDYDFGGSTISNVGYVCGMSVPPIMTKRVVERIIGSGVFE